MKGRIETPEHETPSKSPGTGPDLNGEVHYTVRARTKGDKIENLTVPRNGTAAFSPEIGESIIENVDLPDHGSLCICRLLPNCDTTLEVKTESDVPWLGTISAHRGRAHISLPGTEELEINQATGIIWKHKSGTTFFRVSGGQEIVTLCVNFPTPIFRKYFNRKAPQAIAPYLAPSVQEHLLHPYMASRYIRSAVESALAPGTSGPLRQMQIEGAGKTFIALVIAELEKERRGGKAPSLNAGEIAQAAMEMLRERLDEIPEITEMAAALNTSPKRLNASFKEYFGGTVFEVHRTLRLNQAKDMLKHGEGSVKEVAWAVGYSYVSNFTKAFVARFGTSPAAYARRFSKIDE